MDVKKIEENIYEIPPHKIGKFQMKVPARIYANSYIMYKIKDDSTLAI